MGTNEFIERLYQHYEDFEQGHAVSLWETCRDCKEAAHKITQLQRFIDDMLGDHYVDYLEFYTNRCRELEEKIENVYKILEE